jgi:hypothetical protein
MICREYAFQKLTELSQGDKVLDAAASDIDGFHRRDTYIFSPQLNRPIWSKQSLSTP